MQSNEELVQDLVRLLESRREMDSGANPLTLAQLAELTATSTGRVIKTPLLKSITRTKCFRAKCVVARSGDPASPVALAEDLQILTASHATFEYALAISKTGKSHAFTAAQLKKKLAGKVQKPFQQRLNETLETDQLPAGMGWLWLNNTRYLFSHEDVHPVRVVAPPSPSATKSASVHGEASSTRAPAAADVGGKAFLAQFAKIFERLDRKNGSFNSVNLFELRQALPNFSRDQFDAGLRQLREEGCFSLSASESSEGTSSEELKAGIHEGGTVLVHVSKR